MCCFFSRTEPQLPGCPKKKWNTDPTNMDSLLNTSPWKNNISRADTKEMHWGTDGATIQWGHRSSSSSNLSSGMSLHGIYLVGFVWSSNTKYESFLWTKFSFLHEDPFSWKTHEKNHWFVIFVARIEPQLSGCPKKCKHTGLWWHCWGGKNVGRLDMELT